MNSKIFSIAIKKLCLIFEKNKRHLIYHLINVLFIFYRYEAKSNLSLLLSKPRFRRNAQLCYRSVSKKRNIEENKNVGQYIYLPVTAFTYKSINKVKQLRVNLLSIYFTVTNQTSNNQVHIINLNTVTLKSFFSDDSKAVFSIRNS